MIKNIEVQHTDDEFRLVQGGTEGEWGKRDEVIFLQTPTCLVMAEWDEESDTPDVYQCVPITAVVQPVEFEDEGDNAVVVESDDDDDEDEDEEEEQS